MVDGDQLRHPRLPLVDGAHGDDVAVHRLECFADAAAFGKKRVPARRQSGRCGIVAIDGGGVEIVEGARCLGRVELANRQVFGIVDNVLRRRKPVAPVLSRMSFALCNKSRARAPLVGSLGIATTAPSVSAPSVRIFFE